jgi:hypothetical protein
VPFSTIRPCGSGPPPNTTKPSAVKTICKDESALFSMKTCGTLIATDHFPGTEEVNRENRCFNSCKHRLSDPAPTYGHQRISGLACPSSVIYFAMVAGEWNFHSGPFPSPLWAKSARSLTRPSCEQHRTFPPETWKQKNPGLK